MMTTRFENYSTETLLKIRGNLLVGLERMGEIAAQGTMDVIPKTKGACPPRQAGQVGRILFDVLEIELDSRGIQ